MAGAGEIPRFELREGKLEEWRRAFEEVGALHFPAVASADEVARLQAAAGAVSDELVRGRVERVNGVPIKYGAQPDGRRYVQRAAFSSLFSETIRDFVHDPRFEPIRLLCGADARIGDREKDGVVINHYRNERGSRYVRLGWHTDGLRDVFYGRLPGPMYNIGYYVDDSLADKGCLRLIPGSHRQGLWSMAFRKLYFLDHRDDPAEVMLEARAGDLTVHDGRLWHRVAQATTSGPASQRRTMYVPYLKGPYEPKDEHSPTPLYHRLQRFTG